MDFTELEKLRTCKKRIYNEDIDVTIRAAEWELIGGDVSKGTRE